MSARWEALWYPASGETVARRVALFPLRLLSWLYGAVVCLRRWLYDRGLLTAATVPGVRVISVGNLVVGGSGKTPAVMALATVAAQHGKKVVVLSRGHGRKSRAEWLFSSDGALPPTDEVGDEPRLIASRCPHIWLGIGPDRLGLLRQARALFDVDLAILDDGFQHRKLARQVDLLVFDGEVGLGNGALLPRGPLREPASSAGRATHLWWRLSSAGLGAHEGAHLLLPGHERLAETAIQVRHRIGGLEVKGERRPLALIDRQRVVVLTGIARPAAFVRTVESLGANVVDCLIFPDHHRFTERDLEAARTLADSREASLVTTEKDWMRLPSDFPCIVVRQEVELVAGERLLEEALGLGATAPS